MAFKLASAFVDLLVRDQGLNRGLNAAERTVADKIAGLQGLVATLSGGLAGGALIGGAIKAASDAEEVESKFKAVFKELTDESRAFAERFAVDMNRGVLDTIEKMSSFQDLFVPMGFARDEAAKLSQDLVTLTEDLASFNNLASQDVAENLRSGLVGETEPLRKFGIVINQAKLDAELLALGLAKNAKAATDVQKVQARLSLIMKATGDAQGDAARTAGSFENRLKGLKGAFRDFMAALGQPLMEMLRPVLGATLSIVRGFITLNTQLDGLPSRVLAGAAAFTVLTAAIVGARLAMQQFGITFRFVMLSTGVGAAVVALGVALVAIVEGLRMIVRWLGGIERVQRAWVRMTHRLQAAWIALQGALDEAVRGVSNFVNIITLGAIPAISDMEKAISVIAARALDAFGSMVLDFAVMIQTMVDMWDVSMKLISSTAASVFLEIPRMIAMAMVEMLAFFGMIESMLGISMGISESLADLRREAAAIGEDARGDALAALVKLSLRFRELRELAKKAAEDAAKAAADAATGAGRGGAAAGKGDGPVKLGFKSFPDLVRDFQEALLKDKDPAKRTAVATEKTASDTEVIKKLIEQINESMKLKRSREIRVASS